MLPEQETIEWLEKELVGMRSGRARTEMVENIQADHYGARTPIKSLASLSLADARTIVISPWDEAAIPAINKAITGVDLGAQPVIDGKIIRISLPMLSEEMRNKTLKLLHAKAEDARIRLRKARDEELQALKRQKQDGDATEDDMFQGKKELDEQIDGANKKIQAIIEAKEEEIKQV